MNIQPILFNFPITFFLVYTILEVVRVQRLSKKPFLFHLKATFVLIAFFLSVPAIISGLTLDNNYYFSSQLIEVHNFFIIVSSLVYLSIAAAYSIEWAEESKRIRGLCTGINKIGLLLCKFSTYVLSAPMIVTLALMGISSVICAQAIGIAIVFGPLVNPFVSFVSKLFLR